MAVEKEVKKRYPYFKVEVWDESMKVLRDKDVYISLDPSKKVVVLEKWIEGWRELKSPSFIIEEILFEDIINGASKIEIRLIDKEIKAVADKSFRKNGLIRLTFGYIGNVKSVIGIIQEIKISFEQSVKVIISALTNEAHLNKNICHRFFRDFKNYYEIFKFFEAEDDLCPAISAMNFGYYAIQRLISHSCEGEEKVQDMVSDWQFLKSMLDEEELITRLRGGVLFVYHPIDLLNTVASLKYGAGSALESLIKFEPSWLGEPPTISAKELDVEGKFQATEAMIDMIKAFAGERKKKLSRKEIEEYFSKPGIERRVKFLMCRYLTQLHRQYVKVLDSIFAEKNKFRNTYDVGTSIRASGCSQVVAETMTPEEKAARSIQFRNLIAVKDCCRDSKLWKQGIWVSQLGWWDFEIEGISPFQPHWIWVKQEPSIDIGIKPAYKFFRKESKGYVPSQDSLLRARNSAETLMVRNFITENEKNNLVSALENLEKALYGKVLTEDDRFWSYVLSTNPTELEVLTPTERLIEVKSEKGKTDSFISYYNYRSPYGTRYPVSNIVEFAKLTREGKIKGEDIRELRIEFSKKFDKTLEKVLKEKRADLKERAVERGIESASWDLKGKGEVLGNPMLLAGFCIEILNVGFSEKSLFPTAQSPESVTIWQVEQVKHTIGKEGYRSSFEVRSIKYFKEYKELLKLKEKELKETRELASIDKKFREKYELKVEELKSILKAKQELLKKTEKGKSFWERNFLWVGVDPELTLIEEELEFLNCEFHTSSANYKNLVKMKEQDKQGREKRIKRLKDRQEYKSWKFGEVVRTNDVEEDGDEKALEKLRENVGETDGLNLGLEGE